VDNSLPFDPMGVLISYDMHGRKYTQTIKDENGCATLAGSLEMPIWVRPGTDFTVTVPMRSEFLLPFGEQPANPPLIEGESSQPGIDHPNAPLGTVTIHNSNANGATSMRIASNINDSLYTAFDTRASLDKMVISDTRTIDLPEGEYDFLFFSGGSNVVDRQQRGVGGIWGWDMDIHNNTQQTLSIYNGTGRDITEMYYTRDHGVLGHFIGGDIIYGDGKIKNGGSFTLKLPVSDLDAALVLKDSTGAYYINYAHPYFWVNQFSDQFYLGNADLPTNVTLNYGGNAGLCKFKVLRHDDPPAKKLAKNVSRRLAVDILALTNHDLLLNGDSMTIKLAPGSYYLAAYDCTGKLVGEWANAEITGMEKTFNISTPCKVPGTLKVGEGNRDAFLESVDLQCGDDVDGFTECGARSTVSASELILDLCYTPPDDEVNMDWELLVGALKIDPDGYVYNAAQGMSSKVTGATVTCEVYDEDYQAWSEWPADFYENQVNPQLTASDGYYAFFVPPGLYRVWASAPGYASHTSPDIQVVSEIVHYNIPLQPTSQPPGKIYLPLVVRLRSESASE